MSLLRLTFIDKIGRDPIQEMFVRCDDEKKVAKRTVPKLNTTKWIGKIAFRDLQRRIPYLNNCQLVKTKETTVGGYTGGPMGMRKYIYPTVYEYPFGKEVYEDTLDVECQREGGHLMCSLDPEVS